MAANATQNPVVKTESKSAKKKKAKAEASAETPVATSENNQATEPVEATNGDGEHESPYIKELYKNIRNVNKKISNASKVDNILAENPDKSLEELVSSKKINADQKAQILKKPALQAQLAQLEEQIAQYKKFDEDHKSRAQADKSQLEKTLRESASKDLEEALASVKKESGEEAHKKEQLSLLLISQFLRLAAVRRSEDQDSEQEESKALEGLLAAVYTGNAQAVSAMTNLVQGSDEVIRGVDGEETSVTYAKIKKLATEEVPVQLEELDTAEQSQEDTSTSAVSDAAPKSDPTIVNAGLTEIDADQTAPLISQAAPVENEEVTQNSGFGEGANAAAEANWDQTNDLSTSQEWVEVPRDAAETETGVVATPAAPANTQSWADEQPDSPKLQKTTPPANSNDGFHEVQRNRGQNRNQQGGPYRGRGGRGGDGRGRGGYRGRGDGGRGRGRGGQDRGGRRPEGESQ